MKNGNNIRVVVIIQARMRSTRLPGKVLKKIMGRELLDYQIERLGNLKNVDNIIVATTENDYDDPIAFLCKKIGCPVYRGSENDVLARYYKAAISFDADCIVRINSDCPLIDPFVVDSIIEKYLLCYPKYDYISNILERSYPIGLHTEVFSMDALEVAYKNSIDHDEREHVTPYIYRNKNLFNLKSVKIDKDLSEYRWTVDYLEDFKLIEEILTNVYPGNNNFSMYDVLNYLDCNPQLVEINSGIEKIQTF